MKVKKMANINFEGDDDWSEYRKGNGKKKAKHREENSTWRFDKRRDYAKEEYNEYDEQYEGKVRNW